MLTADKTYYLTADKSMVVEEGSAEAAFLLVAAGGQISQEEAEKYGLRLADTNAGNAPDTGVVIRREPATKRFIGPSEDK